MRTQPWLLASALALVASVAATQPERPRIYYPRAVKRQIANSTTDDLPEPASTTTIQSSTRRGLLDDLLDDVLASRSTSSTRSQATSTKDNKVESSNGGGIIVGPTGIKIPGLEPQPSETKTSESDSDSGRRTGTPTGTPEASSSAPRASSSSSSKLIDLDPVVTDLLPKPTTTNKTEDSTVTSTSASGSSVPSSSTGGLIDLTSLLPPVSETSTGTEPITTSGSSSLPPVTPTPLPTESSTEIPSSTLSLPVDTSSSIPTGTPVTPLPQPTTTESSDIPVTNTTEPTETGTASETTLIQPIITPSSLSSLDPVTPEPEPTTFSTIAPSKPASTAEPESTSTEKNENDWLPTTIVQEATSFSFERPTAEPTGTATALPSNVPKFILPDEPDIKQPDGTTAIQIGFLYPLNWNFVSKSGVAAAQVFKYLPDALANAGEFPTQNVVVTKLVPLDTYSKWGYMTTIAKVWYPTDQLAGLQMQMGVANSRLYNNDKDIVNSLTANINRNIDLFGNIEEENGGAGQGNNNSNNGGDDTFSDNDSSSTTAQDRARTAGIAVGALSLAGLYGAAMFIVARRYKRKRQGHQRASSLTSSQASSEMRYTGAGSPALMGGALLSRDVSSYGGLAAGGRDSHGSGQSGAAHSARTAGISAPVATENSLGWN